MSQQRHLWRFIVVGVGVVASAAWLLSADLIGGPRLEQPRISTHSSSARQDTLDALEEAWANRPDEATPAHARDEKDFINRVGRFSAATLRTESGHEVYKFYRRTVSDFFERYGSEDILDR